MDFLTVTSQVLDTECNLATCRVWGIEYLYDNRYGCATSDNFHVCQRQRQCSAYMTNRLSVGGLC